MNSDGDNNSLGSIASISKREIGGEKETSARTGKKTKKKGIWHRERDGRKETKLKQKDEVGK